MKLDEVIGNQTWHNDVRCGVCGKHFHKIQDAQNHTYTMHPDKTHVKPVVYMK